MNKKAIKFSMKKEKIYQNKWKKIKNKLSHIYNYFQKNKN